MHLKSKTSALATAIILSLLAIQVAGAEDFYARKLEEKNGAILLIVDGMGASYLSTYSYTPLDLDGLPLRKAVMPNLTFIASKGIIVEDIRALLPNTQRGHSIIATGYSNADLEMVSYPDASIYDVLRRYGYLSLAVLEKGDFASVIDEQDIAVYDPSNSIDNPSMLMKKESQVKPDIESFMLGLKEKIPLYLEGKNGIERYVQYDRWAVDSANEIAGYIAQNHPDQKFFLTVNAGAADLAGHNFDVERYIEVIERLDESLPGLYETCRRNNLSLIVTSDHGMKFSSTRGGHSSEKYNGTLESQRIPLIIYSAGIEDRAVADVRWQKDIAPTVLSLLDIVEYPVYTDGAAVPIRSYANLKVTADAPASIKLSRDEELVASTFTRSVTFYGLERGNYTIRVNDGSKEVTLTRDENIYFPKTVEPAYRNNQFIAGGAIISIITIGLLMIRRKLRR